MKNKNINIKVLEEMDNHEQEVLFKIREKKLLEDSQRMRKEMGLK